MRAARGKYSVPTHAREFVAYRGETGSRAVGTRSERPWMDRRLGVELAGPSPTPGSRFSSLSLSRRFSFLLRWISAVVEPAGTGPPEERHRVTEMVRAAGTPARSLPSARPAGAFLSFPLHSNGWPWSRQRTQRTTGFRPDADAGVRDARPSAPRRVHSPPRPPAGCLTCVSTARCAGRFCLQVTTTVIGDNSP